MKCIDSSFINYFQPPPRAPSEGERRAKIQLSLLKHLNYTDELR